MMYYFLINTQRRQNIIKNLNNFFSVKYVTNVYGKELENLIYESKICLNLHYYKESVLETVRLHELLSHHSVIISELPYKDDLLYSKQYQKLLCFVDIIKDDMSNINILISKIDEILKNYSNYNNKYKLKIVEKFSEDIKKEYLFFNDYLKFFKYKNLFHKYFCRRELINTNIKYKVLKNNTTNDFKENLLYAHLHCYNIEEFYTIYGDYLELIEHFFKIIITFSIGNVASSLINSNYLILKIKNKGLDIGGKFCCVHYLNSLNINYDYIFFYILKMI